MLVDLYFFNQNVVRNLYLLKLTRLNLIKKSYCIPSLRVLYLIFNITDITDIDYLGSSNYFYLLKYFFRTNGTICQYTSKFNLGVWYYSFKIRACLKTFKMFFTLYFLINDIFPKIGKEYLIKNRKNMYIFSILDLNMFLDWNSSVGLFYLHHSLEFYFVFNGGNSYLASQLLSFFKV